MEELEDLHLPVRTIHREDMDYAVYCVLARLQNHLKVVTPMETRLEAPGLYCSCRADSR